VGGELVGTSRISSNFFTQMQSFAEARFEKDYRMDYEDCLVQAASVQSLYYHKIDNLIWSEIDDEAHLQRVIERVLPRLKQVENDQGASHRRKN
jgi:choline kinase